MCLSVSSSSEEGGGRDREGEESDRGVEVTLVSKWQKGGRGRERERQMKGRTSKGQLFVRRRKCVWQKLSEVVPFISPPLSETVCFLSVVTATTLTCSSTLQFVVQQQTSGNLGNQVTNNNNFLWWVKSLVLKMWGEYPSLATAGSCTTALPAYSTNVQYLQKKNVETTAYLKIQIQGKVLRIFRNQSVFLQL